MTADRHANMLETVLRKIGPCEPTIDQRLCDAMFNISFARYGGSPKPMWENASKRVAADLEALVSARRKRTDRVWKFTPSQRRALAEQIRISAFNGTAIDVLVRQRSRSIIRAKLWQFNERLYDVIEFIANEHATDGATAWLAYCDDKANKCSNKDRDIVKKRLYACWTVAYAVTTWRELCS